MKTFIHFEDFGLEVILYLNTILAQTKNHKEPVQLNYAKLFSDTDIDKWNNLQIRPAISDNAWNTLEKRLETFLMKLFPNEADKNKCNNILAFFQKAMESSYARTDTGKLQVRQRVASIIDYLLLLPPDAPQLKDMIEMLDFGGEACPDRVMVTIDQAEMYIKFQLAGEKYQANVLANAFKKKNIERLVDPNQGENIETLLYYSIALNEALELGLPTETNMLYEGCAQKKPFVQVFPILFLDFTPDDFISFVAGNEFLRKQWKELSNYKDTMDLLIKVREEAINKVNASDEDIEAYLKEKLSLEEYDSPNTEQIEQEKNKRQKEWLGLKTFLLTEIAKVYEKAGFEMPRDALDEAKARADFIEKKKRDEEVNFTKWNKQLVVVQALKKQLDILKAAIPREGLSKSKFQALIDINQELQTLMEQKGDAELQASLGTFANRIDLLLSKENKSETIQQSVFTNIVMSLEMQERTLNQYLAKSIQAYEKEIHALTQELESAKKMHEGHTLTLEEEDLYYGKQQTLVNAVQKGKEEFLKDQARQLLLKSD